MSRSIAIIITLFMILWGHLSWAESSSGQGKGKKELKAKEKIGQAYIEFNKSLSKGSVGRFRATTVDKNTVIILDTKEGHFWLWGQGISTITLIYGGQVYPGKHIAEIIYEISLKTK